jgi:rifampicin phosphotransferase
VITSRRYSRSLVNCRDAALVGGKGSSLGRLIRAGFQVPGGFVVSTDAYRQAHTPFPEPGTAAQVPPEIAEEIRYRYDQMGRGTVAVRSSATAEDLAAASMAGQCETFLDITGEEALIEAVRRCWASLHTERIRAYLQEHEIDQSLVAMAVVVQRLVPADVAGVLFTADPNGGGRKEMSIDANWGLGETVVGGRVQPDVLRLDATTGRVLSASIADKRVYVSAGTPGEKPVEESRRKQACLSSRDVHSLWQLGRQTEAYFGAPQDIEWAIHDAKLFLLQSRPITTQAETDAARDVINGARQTLRQAIAAHRGPWVLHNLAETLPHPTTLTWSVIKRFMSGSGGFGTMYRRAGFQPSPAVDREGFLELIAGRVYMDVARSPEMFCADFPFAYDVAMLLRDPDASQKPPSVPHGSFSTRMKASGLLAKASATIASLSECADIDFREKTVPEITRWVAWARDQDLTGLSNEDLIAQWQESERQVLDTFGPDTLLPSLICGIVWADLEAFLHEHFWDEHADALLRLIAAGGTPDHTVIADAELFEVAKGTRSLEAWLGAHGHRGPGEFDLAAPRWREQPGHLRDMAARLATGEPPLERFTRGSDASAVQAGKLRAELAPGDAREFDRRLALVHRFMPFREEGKEYLMLAYDQLRTLALEFGRRLDVGDGVFHLQPDEIVDALRVGFAPHHLIEQRRFSYRAELRLTLPRVIDAAAIEQLGEPADLEMSAGGYKALPISGGRASGSARVLHSATEAGDFGTGYILVCPSTDPAWTPLFINAVGLVLECGGTLSHGAVVAREMGLPAVVIADATRLFRTGEELEIDGNNGWVGRTAQAVRGPANADVADPADTRIPRTLIPPPPGAKDRRVASWRNAALGIWAVYLLGFFLLPTAYVRQPSLSLLDFFLWPMVRAWGKPAVVALISVAIAALTLLVQKLVTDNRSLVEAQRRAAALVRQAKSLPEDSPRRHVMTEMAAPVSGRLLMARLVPVCLLLGPMMLPFVWFKERLDPSVPGAAGGSPVQVVATMDGEWTRPVRIEVPSDVALDETTPAARALPPLRRTLEHLLALYREPQSSGAGPWELQVAPDVARMQTENDLERYLDAGLPPQGLTWTVRAPTSASRRFPVSVVTEGHSAVSLNVVLGSQYPPGTVTATGQVDSPVKELRVVYPNSSRKPVFWQPLAALGQYGDSSFLQWLAAVNVGWLWLYVLTYLPALAILRAALQVA